jgi:hypothetical protein
MCIDYKNAPSARTLFNDIKDKISQLVSKTDAYFTYYDAYSINDLPNEIVHKLNKEAAIIKRDIESGNGIDKAQWSPFKKNLLKKLNAAETKTRTRQWQEGWDWTKV